MKKNLLLLLFGMGSLAACAEEADAPTVKDEDAVAQCVDRGKVVGDEEQRDARFEHRFDAPDGLA